MSTRRTFLFQISGLSIGAASLLDIFSGCAITGIASYNTTMENGVVTLALSHYPELLPVGGAVQIVVEAFKNTIVVVHTEENVYVALSPVCTHLGCTVRRDGMAFRCPCHGSTYGMNGALLKGPAEHPLAQYTVKFHEDTLMINLPY